MIHNSFHTGERVFSFTDELSPMRTPYMRREHRIENKSDAAYMYSTLPSSLATKYGSPLPTTSIFGNPDALSKQKVTSLKVE